MQLGCENLKEIVSVYSLVRDCYALEDGTLRIATPFLYPDGSLIDVFLKAGVAPPEQPASFLRGWHLSDFGQTTSYLMDMGIRPRGNRRQWRIIRDVCSLLGVQYDRGELVVWVDPADTCAATDQISRLAQACIRIADLSFLQRYPAEITFKREVKQFLGSKAKGPVSLPGRWGRKVEIDLEYEGPHKNSLVKTVSTGGSGGGIHAYLTEAFSRWYDLGQARHTSPRITLIDDKERITRSDDLDRLKELSTVLRFPEEKDKLNEIVKAA